MGRKLDKTSKSAHYVGIMRYQCANPDCEFGYNIEGHHIIPLNEDGPDEYWNMIALCQKCHLKYKHYGRSQDAKIILYTYKTMQELGLYGFSLDEYDKDFSDKLKTARLENENIGDTHDDENLDVFLVPD